MFPNEIIIKIIEFIYDFKTFKSLRLADKYYYKVCMHIWEKTNLNLNFYPKKTLVNINNCMVCKKYISRSNKIYLNFKNYPKPIYIVCNNWRCINSCFNNMFYFSLKKNIFYFVKLKNINNEELKFKILSKYFIRKENKLYLHKEYIYKNKFYLKNQIVNKNNYKLVSWYRNNKYFKLNDIYLLLK